MHNHKANTQTLTLIRGIPGSGKSTLAQHYAEQMGARHLETDMYFVTERGEYRFCPTKLKVAHHWCKQQTLKALQKHQSVVVSNTFIEEWELRDYLVMAGRQKIPVAIIECTGQYESIHDVPLAIIEKMRRNWSELSIKKLMRQYGIVELTIRLNL
jgi:predicted kinase